VTGAALAGSRGDLAAGVALLAAALLPTLAQARDLVVAPNGDDAWPGTVEQPLRTLQRAASLMHAGDTCHVRAGVYRETVRPARSGEPGRPIAFVAVRGEKAVVSGADPITGWVRDRDKIWKAPMGWTLNTPQRKAGMDQVFVDGRMMPEARWPNIKVPPEAISREDLARAEAGQIVKPGSKEGDVATSRYSTRALAEFPRGALEGSFIFFIPGALWCGATGDVVDSSGDSITFTYNWLSGETFYNTREKDFFYLWGKLEFLDSPGEWHRDAAGVLRLWPPSGDSLEGCLVEAKRRELCFDLRGRSHVTIDGLHIFAGGVETDERSEGIVLDHVDARYVGHATWYAGWWSLATHTCIALRGPNSEIRNSLVSGAAGHCVELSGRGCKAVNNVILDAGYVTNGCNVATGGEEILVERNTLRGTGNQTCLDMSRTARSRAIYNDISHSGRLIMDEAAVWVARDTDGRGTEIAWNTIHDTHAHEDGKDYFHNGAIYLEGRVKNFTIHHNVMWDLKGPGICLPGVEGEFQGVKVYNNTCDNVFNVLKQSGVELRNNVFAAFQFDRVPPGDLSSNLTFRKKYANVGYAKDPGFVDAERRDFRPRPDSPLVDRGVPLPPWTDGFAGAAPDTGAFESGRPPFQAGAVITARHIPDLRASFAGAPGPATVFRIEGLPEGRGLPTDFKLRLGSGPAGGVVGRDGGSWIVTKVPVARSGPGQELRAQIGEGPPVALKSGPARGAGPARPTQARKLPSDDVVAAWDGRLRDSVGAALRSGGGLGFHLAALRQRVRLTALGPDGMLELDTGQAATSIQWARLGALDKASLAAALAEKEPAASALAAFFLLLGGREAEAREHLRAAGDAAAREVLSAFE